MAGGQLGFPAVPEIFPLALFPLTGQVVIDKPAAVFSFMD